MTKRLIALLLIALAVFIWGCPKDDDEKPAPTTQPDNASGSVRSDTSGVIETPAGARISVPVGAVPRNDQGNVGTMVFSIEKNNDIPVTPPTGETVISDVYLFGPEGFTFTRPVEITVPVPEGVDPAAASLWRKNPTSGQAEFFSSSYDPETRKISAQTVQLSPWFVTGHNADATVSGCIRVSNTSHSSWLMVCVDQGYTLLYPEQGDWMPESGSGPLFAPIGTIGWASEGNWYIPQGTFRLCLQRESETNPGQYNHIFMDNVVVHQPWRYNDPRCTNITNGSFTNPDTGRCGCIPVPTTSVGTGDIQVTLTWFNQNPLDLDLWIWGPTGDSCYYGNGQFPDTTDTGAQLDRDNLCGNYINGRPENIYWTRTPPTGQYRVAVDWYSSCGNDHGNQYYAVRVVTGGTTRTYNGTIAPYANLQEVCRFNFSGSNAVFLPPERNADYSGITKPAKVHN